MYTKESDRTDSQPASALVRVGEAIEWTRDLGWTDTRVRGTVKATTEHGVRVRTSDHDLLVLPWSELREVVVLQPWYGDHSPEAEAMRERSR